MSAKYQCDATRPTLDSRPISATAMRANATRLALEAVRTAPTLLGAMHEGPGLDRAAAADAASGPAAEVEVIALLESAITDPTDQLTAAIATLALGAVGTQAGARSLAGLLEHSPLCGPDHVIWALGRGPFVGSALPRLAGFVAGGGFVGMLAQRTLQHWLVQHADVVGSSLELALGGRSDPAGRATLVETLGLVAGASASRVLRRVAADQGEEPAARAAAVAALGDRGHPEGRSATRQLLVALADGTEPLASVARIALEDLDHLDVPTVPASSADRGLTVAQLFLHADVDGDLRNAGRGDTGGIATLLVQLGDALLAEQSVRRVLTVSRGRPSQGIGDLTRLDEPGHHYLSIPLWGSNVPAAQAWSLRVATERGLRRLLREAGGIDVIHLRMADVATMVAAEVAAERGLPIVFTMAPDPNALLAVRDAEGVLTRGNFGAADAVEHLLFRERLLRELQTKAAHLVLFPRPAIARDMGALMNLDIDAEADRVSVVAEGLSLTAIHGAVANADGSPAARALAEFDDLLDRLPPERRGLPLAVSVGRLTAVKGMATLVDAWANDGALHTRCNLLIVGGDVTTPTSDEQQQLCAIDAVLPLDRAAARGLLLPGHRPNATVATWLRAVREGRPGLAAPDGVYVSASLKEEFGIAILEAMATGLVVVAPCTGGPATYVADGVTGVLADTGSRDRLREAISAALDLAAAPGAAERAAAAQAMVRDRFGIETMATALTEIYQQVATDAVGRRHAAVLAP